ncbi:PilC/PilY family type IV pilus protein [Zoogloea sp.]|uniref:pilus assembly protein n=1 Tax=Zoogloea sp. TaxID=49181 RepID=UPI002629615D|nr:PilC/PilY family type IV pilus protein [Zoogloea sp.]MDD3354386.1 PilC/PilY family type IV pilus protein [Zoogloea sp.]
MKKSFFRSSLVRQVWGVSAGCCAAIATAATTPLADQPILEADVPANVMLALSVEFPTAITRAHQDDFNTAKRYLGYFDPMKCYDYGSEYFVPVSRLPGENVTTIDCAGKWSGNFLNWATMQGADTFRWALTGGWRVKDDPRSFSSPEAPLTVLQRALATPQGSYSSSNFPDKYLAASLASKYTPYNTSYRLRISNGGRYEGVSFWQVNSSGNEVSRTRKELNAQVQVCHPDYPESNCQKYTDPTGTKVVWKPEGLIQKYRNKMYFGAFGYLGLNTADAKDANGVGNVNKDGGVLRAMVQSVEPEITETGSFRDDPYGLASTADGISYSGTINYLNRFGAKKKSYKYYDPVSEMYAEVIKYFKGMTPTPSYVSGVNADLRDDFPAFATWNDPARDAKYPTKGPLSCKRNYVVGIGDTNVNYDWNLSGASAPASGVDADMAGGTAKSWTDAVGSLEGISGLGSKGISNGSYLMSGIAYYAHHKDIRPDLPGKQNVTTYWMDVLESGFAAKNQYWLAAKYGGYYLKTNKSAIPDAFNSSLHAWNANGRTYGGNSLPDNYYAAGNPDDMVSGLQNAFRSIAEGKGTAAATGFSSAQLDVVSGGSATYQGSYDANFWSGNIQAKKITSFDADGKPVDSPLWEAASKLDSLTAGTGWDGSRKIVTLVPKDATKPLPATGNLKGAPFRFANLGSLQKLYLSKSDSRPSGDATVGQEVLNYLRGDRSKANDTPESKSKAYRYRESVLGDIVDSKVTYLGKPDAYYADSFNPGYGAFKLNKAARMPVVFAGANDGMLHAFDATESTAGGAELFALIPYSVFEGPDGTPDLSGLQALSRPEYSHRYYMNASVEIRDVDFARAGGTLASSAATSDWRSLLVVGQGKGGRSYVAMDVTSLSKDLTETQLASKVLWEFVHPDLGFTYGQPLIVKTRKWGWVVLLAGGYNNISGPNAGKGVMFVVNPVSGALLQAVYTSAGSAASPSGLAQLSAFTPNYQDYTIDYVYGADLYGNVWRFDLSGTGSIPAPLKFAELTAPDGSAQAVTSILRVEYSAQDLMRYVFVGTGRLLGPEDLPNTQVQTVYAFKDGTRVKAYGTNSNQLPLPSGISFPLQRGVVSQVVNLLSGAPVDDSKPMGWYYDLTGSASGTRERITLNLQTNDGLLTWVGSLMNDDPCNPAGTSRTYSVSYGSGQSRLYELVGGLRSPAQYLSSSKGFAGVQLIRVGNSIRIVGTTTEGAIDILDNVVAQAGDPRVVNWRIIHE